MRVLSSSRRAPLNPHLEVPRKEPSIMQELLNKLTDVLHDLSRSLEQSAVKYTTDDLESIHRRVLTCQRNIRGIADVLDRRDAMPLEQPKTNG